MALTMKSFSGLDKLRFLREKLTNDDVLRVGFLESATYRNDAGLHVAQVAFWQEFGVPSRGIPPRPFFRTAIAKNEKDWEAAFAALLKQNDFDVQKSMLGLGIVIQGDIQNSIASLTAPELSQVTLKLRELKKNGVKITGAVVGEAARLVAQGKLATGVSTKPLVDTGQLIAAVDYEIKSRG